MAARRQRRHSPGRALIVFFIGIGILYGLAALTGTWKPALGLDLEGGTQIRLSAKGSPSKESLDEARRIIDERVNASGVSAATVTTQGSSDILVSIPKTTSNADQLEQTAERQAVLRFRLVACRSDDPSGPCASSSSPAVQGQPAPGQTAPTPAAPTTAPGSTGKSGTTGKTGKTAPGNGRPVPGFGRISTSAHKPKPSSGSSSKATSPAPSTAASSPTATATPGSTSGSSGASSSDPNSATSALAFMNSPDPAAIAEFDKYTCVGDQLVSRTQTDASGQPKPANLPDIPSKPLVACTTSDTGHAGTEELLSPSVIEGTELTDASASVPQNQVAWQVEISMGSDRSKAYPPGTTDAKHDFATISKALLCSDPNGAGCKQFAIVLDGKVISDPTMEATITNGKSSITGNFSETQAKSLATSLKFGALPIAFKKPTKITIGPSLAGDQLNAGILAGAIGLALVMLYCLLYYRGLGIVVVASLFVAAAITYAMVLLLAKSAGFTLTLPGIAGLIIAVGITADSFVIFFERIRDEMREGKSMRVAVESGWHRARITRLAANTVSVLSALVLYIFASGDVKGFGFALGLSTLVDLAVLFWFTKPMVSFLAQFRAFNSGGKWSGLSKETLGTDVPAVAGGRA